MKNAERFSVYSSNLEVTRELSQQLGLRLLTSQLLLNRGLRTKQEVDRFLHPKLSELRLPEGNTPMAGFSQAVDRLMKAVLKGEVVGIFGDYDVDGITTCALFTDFLRQTGLLVIPRIARRSEGYGFNIVDATYFLKERCSLIITCDCGTSDHQTLAFAKDAGVDVIVVDHHQVPDRQPDALALLNPHQPQCVFPFKGMASVGIGFYVIAALRTRLREEKFEAIPELREFLDLVALGTVADLAPLVQENRILVTAGLLELKGTRRPGLRNLGALAGLSRGVQGISDIAFRLAPRLNAPGRLGGGEEALGALIEKDSFKASEFARICQDRNQERQIIQQEVLGEALRQAEDLVRRSSAEVLVVAQEGWHSGVVGIIAAKLVEEYNRPAIVIAIDGGIGRGSARTAHGFHLYQGLKKADSLLLRYGGHAAAAGLTIEAKKIQELREALSAIYQEQLAHKTLGTVFMADAEIQLEQLDLPLVEEISALAPFGMGNPEPTFLVRNAEIVHQKVVGKEHLQLTLRSGRTNQEGIGFGLAKRKKELEVGSRVQATFVPEIDQYYLELGTKKVRIRIREISVEDEFV